MIANYIGLVGEHYPNVECHTTGATSDYNAIVWKSTVISKADLDQAELIHEMTLKITSFSVTAGNEITDGFISGALGFPHWYDSAMEDQLNLIGAVTTGVTMPYSCRSSSAGYQTVDVGGAKLGTDPTGYANSNTTYNAEIKICGVSTFVSITGTEAQTLDQLLQQIQADLDLGTNAANVALVDGNITISCDVFEDTSSIEILDSDLFSLLTGYVGINTAVSGISASATTFKEYKIHTHAELVTVINDGKDVKLTILQKFNVKKAQILACTTSAEIDAITW